MVVECGGVFGYGVVCLGMVWCGVFGYGVVCLGRILLIQWWKRLLVGCNGRYYDVM